MKCNPGWEELDAWLDSLDMSGPTPGCFRVVSDGVRVELQPVDLRDFTIEFDRERLIDAVRD